MCNTVTSNKSRPKTRMECKVADAAEHERRIPLFTASCTLSQHLPMKTLSLLKGESTSMTKVEEAAENQRRRARKKLELFGSEHTRRPGALTANETWWCQHYSRLKNQGYLLRSRYAPDWVPSWEGTERNPFTCEDGRSMRVRNLWLLHHLLADGCIVWPSHGRNACI